VPKLDYDNIELFTGKEVEHTPAYGMQTLFVNGKTDVNQILEHATEHVYLGANHCKIDVDNWDELQYYNNTIKTLLKKGYWVTFDYEAHNHDVMLSALDVSIWKHKKFIPMLSVHVPDIKTSNPNLTVKIADDVFNGNNGGVWCMDVNDMTEQKFTPWKDYTKDEALTYK
jgi:hypothetical protein